MNWKENLSEKRMNPEAVRRMIGLLASTRGTGTSLYSPPIKKDDDLQLPGGIVLPEEVKIRAQGSSTGFAVFSQRQNTETEHNLVLPPFPVGKALAASYIETAPLIQILEGQYVIGIILIRLGSFAFGVSKGQNLITSKVGTGLVHGRHRQGGSSANRFARHREKQIEVFFTRACSYLREYLEPHIKEIDYMLYGGAWTTIQEFKKQCPFTGLLKQPELPSLLNLPDPRQTVLLKALERTWSSRVFTWTGQQ
ncbi:MAG: Vms1/Ankzf1 family peptidyl-tRNA hydrolase [Dehalococcoidales bacterium]|jgi:peptide subunit release factor 1 (eRF1)|nr:Vms1/Ankzf1 family peptidyl-tRNA hydrolase [Dehalococcoidales bacterium]MDD4466061.1 Vms1/Ankzf1 family peptidyl-tRNA hydrolase [Dehalococcoidales bacterium]MDD5402203.1 Vms1/Ankzf1 family peptidyl-tRNA hydrolase [Dehalococcoidales bacterium]